MTTTLFHSLSYADTDAAMAFLEAVGFTRRGVYTDDAGRVVHAQYDWDDSGGVMFGAASGEAREGWVDSRGHAQCYCVVSTDADVDAVHDKAVGAGATSVRPPEDQDYGGRGCTVRDAEGNQWSFGSYPGE